MTARGRPRGDGAEVEPGRLEELLADPRITAVGLLMEAVDGLSAKLAVQLARHDLASAEFEVLLRIARTSGQAMRMTDLAAQTSLTTSGITRVVDRLERDGLVERRACPTDRRGALAALTTDGRARLDAVLPGHLDLVEKWLVSRLPAAEFDALLASLRTIRDGVRPDATAGA